MPLMYKVLPVTQLLRRLNVTQFSQHTCSVHQAARGTAAKEEEAAHRHHVGVAVVFELQVIHRRHFILTVPDLLQVCDGERGDGKEFQLCFHRGT